MGRIKPDCDTCMYRAENRIWKCNYETITGHTRLAVPANRCKHYKEGPVMRATTFELMEKVRRAEGREDKMKHHKDLMPEPVVRQKKERKREQKPKEPRYDWEKAQALYEAGKNDAEIARELGCTANSVRLWRKRCGHASRVPKGWHPEPRYDWAKGRALYDAGWSDANIAKELGCSNDTVGKWRKREKLPANKSVKLGTKLYDWDKGRKLYEAGMNDCQIAKELGCTDKAVRNWRFRRKLPANRVPGFIRKEVKEP